MSAREEPELIAKANGGDEAALSRLLASHRRVVVEVAARYARPGIAASDLLGEGMVGLLEAVRRCRPDRGARLATYARWWIRARVHAYALANRNIVPLPSTRNGRRAVGQLARTEAALRRTLGRTPTRLELAREIGVEESDIEAVIMAWSSRDETLSAAGEGGLELGDELDTPEQRVADVEQRERLRLALARLPARESSILEAQLADEELTLAELAPELGLSAQRASQLASRARQLLLRAFQEAR